MLGLGETGQHEADHCQIDHRFPGVSLTFVVAVEPAIASQPAKGALDDPASGKHLEAVAVGALDDGHEATPGFSGPVDQRSGIAAVGPDEWDTAPRRAGEERAESLMSLAVAAEQNAGPRMGSIFV